MPDTALAPRTRLSLVIPVKDEAESLRPLVSELVEAGLPAHFDLEVLLVDDGSSDQTPEIIAGLMGEHVFLRCLRLDRTLGKSAALDAGFRAARGEILAMMDGDLQNDPRDLLPMIDTLRQGFDLVSGRRERRADTLWRRVQSRIANHVRQFVLRDHATDCGCGIKVLRRECVARLPMFRGAHRFMEALIQAQGFRFKQIPVNDRPRRHGEPKYTFRRRGILRPTVDMLGVLWLRSRMDRCEARPVEPPEPRG